MEDPSWFAGDETDKDRQVSNIIALLLSYEIRPFGYLLNYILLFQQDSH